MAVADESGICIWDCGKQQKVRHLKSGQVNSVSWAHSLANQYMLSSGGSDGVINNHDVRVRNSIVNSITAHKGQIGHLAWSNVGHDPSSTYLATSSYEDSALGVWSLRDLLQGQKRVSEEIAQLWHNPEMAEMDSLYPTHPNMPV